MPVKKESKSQRVKESKKNTVITSLRAKAKQSRSVKIPNKIASSRTPRNDKMSVPIYSLAGRASGTLTLPKEIFGQKVNEKLLAQAMRVYTTNQKTLPGNTKTRGEVVGSTAKVWRQKGTGRARHGAITAPIFVGGGIVFGPKPRNLRLGLPQKMKKAALFSALSSKAGDKEILGISGINKASGKTKEMAKLLNKINSGKSTLIVTGERLNNVVLAVRNIPNVNVLSANLINAYEVLKHGMLLVTKDAVDKLIRPQTKEAK